MSDASFVAEFHLKNVDALINSGKYDPRWGWHDDHKGWDGSSSYLPALMQVKSEYAGLLEVLARGYWFGGSCLQLGMGECTASHDAFLKMFYAVTTVSFGVCASGLATGVSSTHEGLDTHTQDGLEFAKCRAPYDLLFIDAGHTYEDVKQDYEMYAPLVSRGGIIAFHDALKRPGFEEVEVWRFLETLKGVTIIGDEVGIGWMVKK